MYVTEDTTRADPESLRALFTTAFARAPRGCASPTRWATPRQTARGRSSATSEVAHGRARVGRRHRLARPFATGASAWPTHWRRSRPARRRLHGAALGIGERCGNTPMDLLLVNLVMMGYIDRDLTSLPAYCAAVARACDVPHPAELSGRRRRRVPHRDRRARRGGHEGVSKGRSRADGRRLRGGAREPGRTRAGDRGRADVGPIERRLLAGATRDAGHRRDRRSSLRRGQGLEPYLSAAQVQAILDAPPDSPQRADPQPERFVLRQASLRVAESFAAV